MRTYDYNYGFLEQWRVANGVEKGEMAKVTGSNRNNLDEWLGVSKAQREAAEKGAEPKRKMLKLGHLLALCNRFEGLELIDFFTIDGRPMAEYYEPRQKRTKTDKPDSVQILELKVKHYEELERVRNEGKASEERMRKTIAEQQERIGEMLGNAVRQQELITQLQGTVAELTAQLAEARSDYARLKNSWKGASAEKGDMATST